jgi:hypothetical protein
MKMKYVILTAILAFALTHLTFGQDKHADMTKSDTKNQDISTKMGKPIVEATVKGLNMKVWFMTQGQYKKLMGEGDLNRMKDTSRKINKAMMDPMMSGTHHIMLDIKDVSGGKEIDKATAQVLIMTPSKKNTTVDLKSMINHFAGALTLVEGGNYQFKVTVIVAGVPRTTQFQYELK